MPYCLTSVSSASHAWPDRLGHCCSSGMHMRPLGRYQQRCCSGCRHLHACRAARSTGRQPASSSCTTPASEPRTRPLAATAPARPSEAVGASEAAEAADHGEERALCSFTLPCVYDRGVFKVVARIYLAVPLSIVQFILRNAIKVHAQRAMSFNGSLFCGIGSQQRLSGIPSRTLC